MSFPSPSEFLREELQRRTKSNPAYSVRALARDSGMSPAFCSQVLSRKRLLSEDRAARIATRLKFDSNQKKLFVLLARLEAAKSSEARIEIVAQINKLDRSYFVSRKINLDIFKYLVDWHYFGLLELIRTADFVAKVPWIARRLGLPSTVVKQAIARLVRLGLVTYVDGNLARAEENMSVGDIPSDWIRMHHEQGIRKALEAVHQQTFNERILSTVTFAINPERLPQANQLIQNFRREMMALLEEPPRSEVYQLSIQLFRLSQKIQK